jgi:predicted transcriptional regulator
LKKKRDSKVESHRKVSDDDFTQSKRTQIELIVEFLGACREPIKKTHLIYQLQINHYQLQSYVKMLLKFGMIQEITKPFSGFVITQKGLTLLEMFDNVSNQRIMRTFDQ